MSESRHEQQKRRSPDAMPLRRDRRPSSVSVASTTGASSYDTVPETEEYSIQSPAPEMSERRSLMTGTSPGPEEGRAHHSRGHSRSQSVIETRSANTRRRDKAAVGFACLNCKRAHLACDVARPCRRCIQMGRSSTCTDVPHKRRGRPRLRDSQQLPSIPADLSSPQQSEAGPSTASSARHRRGHSRTGSMNSPYMDFYPSPTRPTWSLNSSRRPLAPASRHDRSPSLVHAAVTGPQHPHPPPHWQLPAHEPPHPTSATLFVSVDLTIIRALPDANNFFSAASSQIQGRALIQLCHQNDKGQIPRLMHALQSDVQTNRLMFRAHDHRQSLTHDLEPYTDPDLSHPFPGAQEHLLSLTFVDALGRHIPARMAAVLGSRSNDRFAYVIISIQRQEQQHVAPATPRSLTSAPSQSPRAYEPSGFPGPPPPSQSEYNARSLPTSNPIQSSPTYAHRQHSIPQQQQQQQQQQYQRHTSAPRPSNQLNPGPTIPTTAISMANTTTTTTTTNRGLLSSGPSALNVLPPLQAIAESAPVAIPTLSPRRQANLPGTTTTAEGADPGSQSSDTSSRRSSKRISMSLSDIID